MCDPLVALYPPHPCFFLLVSYLTFRQERRKKSLRGPVLVTSKGSHTCNPKNVTILFRVFLGNFRKKVFFKNIQMPRAATNDNTSSKIASPFITQQIWEMSNLLERKMDCPVCLESVMRCRHCFCLLMCGHTSCFPSYLLFPFIPLVFFS